MAQFGQRLKTVREREGLSQDKLGAMIGAARQQVHAWEKQENAPNGETVKVLAQALGVSSDYLLELSDDPAGGAASDLSVDERYALAAWRRGDKLDAIKVIAGG